jgi:DNA primase catalytic subunit
MLFVFSGNRGIHVWVPKTELYSSEYRCKIVDHIGRIDARVSKEAKDMFQRNESPDAIAEYTMKNSIRIDFNVTKSESHCLKCPFSMHPTTRKISLPLPMDMLEAILPSCMPDVTNVCDPNNVHLLETSLKYFSRTMVFE